jgi:hypothetical protein
VQFIHNYDGVYVDETPGEDGIRLLSHMNPPKFSTRFHCVPSYVCRPEVLVPNIMCVGSFCECLLRPMTDIVGNAYLPIFTCKQVCKVLC